MNTQEIKDAVEYWKDTPYIKGIPVHKKLKVLIDFCELYLSASDVMPEKDLSCEDEYCLCRTSVRNIAIDDCTLALMKMKLINSTPKPPLLMEKKDCRNCKWGEEGYHEWKDSYGEVNTAWWCHYYPQSVKTIVQTQEYCCSKYELKT